MEAVTHAEILFAKSPDITPPILNVVLGVALLTTEAFGGPLPRKLLRHFRLNIPRFKGKALEISEALWPWGLPH